MLTADALVLAREPPLADFVSAESRDLLTDLLADLLADPVARRLLVVEPLAG